MLKGHGGVVIGSEMSGDVRRVTISNCVFDGTDRGIRIKSTRGRGGIVEDIRVSNIVMKDIVKEAFRLNMFYRPVPPEPVSERTPRFRNIHLSDITVIAANQAGTLLGLDEMVIQDVSFNNITIHARKGFEVRNVRHIEFHNVAVNVEEGPAFRFEQANSVELDGVSSNAAFPDTPVVDLKNVQNERRGRTKLCS